VSPLKAALLFGIDEYDGAPLGGCANDARAMEALLARNEDGSPNFDCRTLVAPLGESGQITKAVLRGELREMLSKKIDMAVVYFAGHGVVTPSGGFLVTQDWQRHDEGVAMHELVDIANGSPIPQITIIVDACFSGKLGEMPSMRDNFAVLHEGVAILSASAPDQTAAEKEEEGRGLFTGFVCAALEGGGADVLGEVTSASIYAYAEQIMGPLQQRPMYKANVARLDPLRTCAPIVEPKTLRKLPEYFEQLEAVYKLDPAYEPDHSQHPPNTTPDPAKEAIFRELQQLRDARLLVPHDAPHMFYAAIHSKGCRLTPLGHFYWRLAKEKRL
jgi:hypothetical protein